MLYGSRVRQAREVAGFTQQQLAQCTGVNQSAIAQIETGICAPSTELLDAIAQQTGFLPSFFERVPPEGFSPGSLAYRSRRSATAKQEKAVYGNASLLFEQVTRMAGRVKLPPQKLPKIAASPSIAAQRTRPALGATPDEPIRNLMSLVEDNGVVVVALPLFLDTIDAFSTWANLDTPRPVIALTSGRPTDRLRFSIAHEIGHLVMHPSLTKPAVDAEREANEFAGELLLPARAMQAVLRRPVTLTSLARLKMTWGVSMQALILRARNLDIISQRQARYLFTQMSVRGWRQREPSNLDLAPETPQLVTQMIESLYDSTEAYGRDMGLAPSRAREQFLFA